MKRKMIFFLAILTSSSFYLRLNAQTPSNDANWQIDELKSDEFSGTSLT